MSSSLIRHRTGYTQHTVDPTKQDGVVYRIPIECGKVFIGETERPMKKGINENDRNIRLACTQTSPVFEHAHETDQYSIWNEVKFVITLIMF